MLYDKHTFTAGLLNTFKSHSFFCRNNYFSSTAVIVLCDTAKVLERSQPFIQVAETRLLNTAQLNNIQGLTGK